MIWNKITYPFKVLFYNLIKLYDNVHVKVHIYRKKLFWYRLKWYPLLFLAFYGTLSHLDYIMYEWSLLVYFDKVYWSTEQESFIVETLYLFKYFRYKAMLHAWSMVITYHAYFLISLYFISLYEFVSKHTHTLGAWFFIWFVYTEWETEAWLFQNYLIYVMDVSTYVIFIYANLYYWGNAIPNAVSEEQEEMEELNDNLDEEFLEELQDYEGKLLNQEIHSLRPTWNGMSGIIDEWTTDDGWLDDQDRTIRFFYKDKATARKYFYADMFSENLKYDPEDFVKIGWETDENEIDFTYHEVLSNPKLQYLLNQLEEATEDPRQGRKGQDAHEYVEHMIEYNPLFVPKEWLSPEILLRLEREGTRHPDVINAALKEEFSDFSTEVSDYLTPAEYLVYQQFLNDPFLHWAIEGGQGESREDRLSQITIALMCYSIIVGRAPYRHNDRFNEYFNFLNWIKIIHAWYWIRIKIRWIKYKLTWEKRIHEAVGPYCPYTNLSLPKITRKYTKFFGFILGSTYNQWLYFAWLFLPYYLPRYIYNFIKSVFYNIYFYFKTKRRFNKITKYWVYINKFNKIKKRNIRFFMDKPHPKYKIDWKKWDI